MHLLQYAVLPPTMGGKAGISETESMDSIMCKTAEGWEDLRQDYSGY